MRRVVIIILIVFYAKPIISQELEFYREDLKFLIQDESFIVSGDYYFCNIDSLRVDQLIYYPFPFDSAYYGEIDSIKVETARDKPLSIRRTEKGILFSVSVMPYSTAVYNLCYKQKIKKNRVEYIFTTTQMWRRPLEVANFQIMIPDKYRMDSVNYEPDSVSFKGAGKKYFWHKTGFMPEENFLFYFRRE